MSTLTLITNPTPTASRLDQDKELEALAEAALKAKLRLTEAEGEAKATKEAFRKALDARGLFNPDFKGIGAVQTVIKAPSRFDPKKAEQLLSQEEIARYSTLSGTLVKANVTPDTYALMQSPGTVSLELKAGV